MDSRVVGRHFQGDRRDETSSSRRLAMDESDLGEDPADALDPATIGKEFSLPLP